MSVAVETTKVSYAGTGVVGPYTYPFKIWVNSDLMAIKTDALGVETVLALNTDYTVSGAGITTGGTVMLTAVLPAGSTLTLMRVHPYLQSQNYTSLEAITATSLNNALDKLDHQIQQLKERTDRAFSLPRSSLVSGPLYLRPLASHLIGWDAAGESLRNYATTTVQSASLDVIGNYGDNLATAVSVIGSGVQDLWIDKAITLTGDVIVPQNITLHVLRAGRINGTYNLSIGNLVAGRWQIFGMGATKPTVVFDAGAVEHGYYPEWWGADPSGATDSGAALEEMIVAIKRSAVGETHYVQAPVSLAPKGTYLCQRGLFPGQGPTDGTGVYGVEGNGARIIFENVAGSCKVAWDLTGKKFGYLRDVIFQGGISDGHEFEAFSNAPEILVLMSRPYHVGGGANAHHWQNIQLRGAATVAGVYNYGSEGWHVQDTTFWVSAPQVVVITKSNFLGYTIPNEWGGAYAALASESCIEFLFHRVNFFATTLTGESTATDSVVLVEGATSVKIDHCEIGANHCADIPLMRVISGYLNGAIITNNMDISDTTFHPAASVITLPILESGNVTTSTDYKWAIYFQHGGSGTYANIRKLSLSNNKFMGATASDIYGEANTKLYGFKAQDGSSVKIDLSESGCSIVEDSIIRLSPVGTASSLAVDGALQGDLYASSTTPLTFDSPASVTASIHIYDTVGPFGGEATVTHDYGATATAYTLTPVDLAQLGTLRLTNASGAADCIVPAAAVKTFGVLNISGQTITIKYSGSTGVSIAHNKRAMLRADGAEIKEILAAY